VTLSAPPVPPGSLTSPPKANDVLTYLDALGRWSGDLRTALDSLDVSARVAHDPGAYTGDIVLAMSLWRSIDARRQELVKVWDSGRVLDDELAHIATLMWGRLTDPLGAPAAFTLPEACTLAAALEDRLSDLIATDAVASSGAAARIDPVRAAIGRCLHQADALGVPKVRIEQLSAEFEAAVAGSNPQVIAQTVDRVDAEISLIERDLIKETSRRAGAALQYGELVRRQDDLVALEGVVRSLADRCAEKIADPPRLGIPAVAQLGAIPGRKAPREEVAQYAERLGRAAAALAIAQERYGAPLRERDDLRGLLGAYRDRVAKKGLAEDAALDARYRAAHDALFRAPCDLTAARTLVSGYQHAVRVAVGAEIEPDVAPADAPREEQT
jgi:hypothetical protein